jgi:hypothetical protein
MATYNGYKKEEDFMMWELHKIRKEMALKKMTPNAINKGAKHIIAKYKLKRNKLIKSSSKKTA